MGVDQARAKDVNEVRRRGEPAHPRPIVPVSKPTEQHEIVAREAAGQSSAIAGATQCSTCAAGGMCASCARRYAPRAGLVPDAGESLPRELRAHAESRLGPIGDVRIHTGAAAAAAAERLDARAYAFGRSIVFGTGAFAPETFAGMQLLIHELRHTQQDPEGAMVHRQPSQGGASTGGTWKPPAWFPLPTEVPAPPPYLAGLHQGMDAYVDRRVRGMLAEEIGPIEELQAEYGVLPYDYSQPLEIPARRWEDWETIAWEEIDKPAPTMFRQGKRLAGGYTLAFIAPGNRVVIERDGIGYVIDEDLFSYFFGREFPELYREFEAYPRWAHEHPFRALIGHIALEMMSPENLWMSLPFMIAAPFLAGAGAVPKVRAPSVRTPKVGKAPKLAAAEGRAAGAATAAEGRAAGAATAAEARVGATPRPSAHAPAPEVVAPPTQVEIAAMHQLETGPALKKAAEFAQHPGTVYHHNIGKGGTRAILETNTMLGGEGTASFGGGTSVRAWFGEAPVMSRTSPTIEFTVPGPRPDVRLYMGRPGLKWNVDALSIQVRKVYLPDGRIAVPEGGGYFKVTASDGTVSRMHVSEFPE